jgi:Thaumatin family
MELYFCHSSTFTISNYYSQTIWPGTLAGFDTPALSSTGFVLQPGQTARAYSYAYDDKTSTFTCSTAIDYTIAFCPPANAYSLHTPLNSFLLLVINK